MSDIAVRVEHLSKMYRLGVINSGTLRKDIQTWLALKLGKEDPNSKIGENKYAGDEDHFWALKDVSFDVKKGDRVGIIGKNGAGKSTLLKIMSRITAPTEGTIKIKGKVASLLEVGTGFNGELTGRENVYLNGAILGMKKRQVAKKMDSIIDFSGIEHHIDTPVKRYSSGMYVRLAFAVAAHLDSDILIADEVLAVGDAEFQKKALGKMEDLSTGEGRTVFFVSHNMGMVEKLCNYGIILEKGKVKASSDNIKDMVKEYLHVENTGVSSSWENTGNLYSNRYFTPTQFFIGNYTADKLSMPLRNDDDFYIHIFGETQNLDPSLQIGYSVQDEKGNLLYWSCFNDMEKEKWPIITCGQNHFYSKIPKYYLNEGCYKIEIIVALYFREWICQPGRFSPEIMLEIQGGLSNSPFFTIKRSSILSPVLQWFKE